MSLLVTDGEQRATLAVVRAVGSAGIPVTVGSSERDCLAGRSRYCTDRVIYPPPERGEEFLQALLAELQRRPYDVLFPMTDLTLQLIASVRASIPPSVRLPFPSQESVLRVQNKREMLALAAQFGIACPRTVVPTSLEELQEIARTVRYPVVIKPRFSRFLRDGNTVVGSVRYASDGQALIRTYRQVDAQIPQPLIQERLAGEGKGVFLLIWDGELKAGFCHRRLREKPPWGGASVYCESLPPDRGLIENSLAMLKAVGWQGVAMIEFKVDQQDGLPKLMEVNGRFWGSLQLAIDAGVNFPLMLYRLAMGESVPPKFDYRVGVRSRWLLGDLDHLIIRLMRSGPSGVTPSRQRSKLGAVSDFMNFFEPQTKNEVLRWDDPSPAWFEFRKYVRDFF